MRRKQRGDEEAMDEEESEMTEEAIVNRIYDELKSRSFVEQLRLECIVDVKKKETYMKLQDRIKEYLTKKMSNDSWMDDDFNADVFRGQIVECGVLAITVERIVDAVVTRKLHEELKPMITKMVKDFCHSNLSRLRQQRTMKKSGRSLRKENSCFEETASFVRKICEDTQRDSKKLFEDSFIAKSLARVFNSSLQDSDDDGEISDMSSNDGDHFQKEGEHNMSNKRKRNKSSTPKKDDVEPEQVTRVKRERKFNPKYSPSLYQTSMLSPSVFNGHTTPTSPSNKSINTSESHNAMQKTPVTKPKPFVTSEVKLPTTNSVKSHDRTGETKSDSSVHVKKEVVNNDIKLNEDTTMYFAKKSSPKPQVGNSAKVSPSNRRHPATTEPLRKSSNVEDVNGFVRKSGRPRKLNSMIFSDTFQGSSVMMDNVLAPKSPLDAAETKVSVKVEAENSEAGDPSSNPETKQETHSSQRYDESDLYKPRPVINSSGNRSRRA